MRGLRVQIEDAGANTAILRASGKITLGEEASEFRDASKKAFALGKRNIIVDMSGVTYIDSAGMGELVISFARARTEGVQYALTGLGPMPKGLLTATRMIHVFKVFDSEDQALAYFEGSQAASAT